MGAAATGPLHGRLGIVKAGALTIGFFTAWRYEENAEESEKTAMGDSSRSYLLGINDGTFTGTAWWHRADTGQTALRSSLSAGSTVTLNIYPEGEITTDDELITGTIVINAMTLNADKDSIIETEFTGRGTLTQTQVA